MSFSSILKDPMSDFLMGIFALSITACLTCPVSAQGGGFGRIFNVGKQPINAQVQAFSYADKPAGGPDWTLRTQRTFLFPK